MSDLRPENGDAGRHEDGSDHTTDGQSTGSGRPGVPGLPAQWGIVLIPDDAAELDKEAGALRRELRRAARRNRVRRLLHLTARRHPPRPDRGPQSPPAVSFVIMTLALLLTLVSLFVVTWGRRPGPPLPPTPSDNGDTPSSVDASVPSPTSPPASQR